MAYKFTSKSILQCTSIFKSSIAVDWYFLFSIFTALRSTIAFLLRRIIIIIWGVLSLWGFIIAICIGSNHGMHFSVFIQSTPYSKMSAILLFFNFQFSPFASFLSSKFKRKRFGLNAERRPPLNANIDLIRKWRLINCSLVFTLKLSSVASLACKNWKEFLLSNEAGEQNKMAVGWGVWVLCNGTMGPVPYPRQYSGIGITVNVKGDFRFSASSKEVASRGFASHVFLVIFI